MFDRITVCGRREIPYVLNSIDRRVGVISITDPPPMAKKVDFKSALKRPNLKSVLQLEFVDVDPTRHDSDIFLHWTGKTLGESAMQECHAKRVWEFLHLWADQVDELLVNCEAGISRSTSTAKAIVDKLGLPRTAINHVDQHGQPVNKHVYNLVTANAVVWDRLRKKRSVG